MSDAILYRDRATKHAPKTVDEIVRAVRDLKQSGFSAATISAILNLDIVAVQQMLGQRSAA